MAIALAALVVALGGAAFAAIPDSNGTIHACYQKNNGNLRVVESVPGCKNSENAIAWTQRGTGPGDSRTSGIVRMDGGGSAVLLHVGPFTWTAKCERVDGHLEVTGLVESSEPNSVFRQGVDDIFIGPGAPRVWAMEATDPAANADQFWSSGLTVGVAAPSGASADFIGAVGVKVLGSDCVAKVTVLGVT